MKIFGHPIHVMLIHFPSALFPMDLACFSIAYFTNIESLQHAAFYAMIGGALSGWIAVITGMIDLGALFNKKPTSMKKALIHGGINSTMLIGYSIFAFIAFNKYPQIVKDDVLILSIKAVLVVLMIAGNFIGGSLVLKDKVLSEN